MTMRRSAIRSLVEKHGVDGYLKIQAQMLGFNEDGTVPRDSDGHADLHESFRTTSGREMPRKSAREFSLRALWEALEGPVEETLPHAFDQVGVVGLSEAVGTGGFPQAVGQLIASEVIEAYNMTDGFIGDELVRTFPSDRRGENIVGFTAAQGPKEVAEGQPYPEASFAEKHVGTRETKRGRLISVTEELVMEDQTGQVLERARNIGEAARQDRERRIVLGVIDHDSSNEIYQPDGSAEQLYASANNNVDTGTGSLQDFTDIQSVMAFHANNVTDDRQADDTAGQQPLTWMPRVLLTAVELSATAQSVVNATEVRQQIGSNAEHIMSNPNANIRPMSSPFIDQATSGDQFDDTSDWFLGDFRKQFRYKEIWPLQTFRAPAQNEKQFERDVVARFKVREYGDVFAIDERWVVKVDVA